MHSIETFGRYWERWLGRRRPDLEDGTWSGYEINGRKRLLPAFANRRLGALSVDDIRTFVADQAEAVEAGELAAKTVNNALVTLVVCLNDAVEDGLIPTNPALRVGRLPAAHVEREYLRLHEITMYLDSCSDLYRPLAEVLIGSGIRISEALALRISDLELDDSGGVIVVYRSRKKAIVGSTKSDRFRSVEIGPRTSLALRTQIAWRREFDIGLADDALVFVMPVRGRKRSPGRWESAGVAEAIDRTTVSRDWHKQALEDAGLRDMPLHALRHTAAASWLGAGNSLMYVEPARTRRHRHDRALLTGTWSGTSSLRGRSRPRKRSLAPSPSSARAATAVHQWARRRSLLRLGRSCPPGPAGAPSLTRLGKPLLEVGGGCRGKRPRLKSSPE